MERLAVRTASGSPQKSLTRGSATVHPSHSCGTRRFGTLPGPTLALLSACVRGRLNFLSSGGRGAGKTTLLNVLADFIPPRESLVSIEDPAGRQQKQIDGVSLETRPPNLEGRGQVA